MCIFLRNKHMEAKALFSSCFLSHSFWEGHSFFFNFLVVLFEILSPLDIDLKVLCEQKMSIN